MLRTSSLSTLSLVVALASGCAAHTEAPGLASGALADDYVSSPPFDPEPPPECWYADGDECRPETVRLPVVCVDAYFEREPAESLTGLASSRSARLDAHGDAYFEREPAETLTGLTSSRSASHGAHGDAPDGLTADEGPPGCTARGVVVCPHCGVSDSIANLTLTDVAGFEPHKLVLVSNGGGEYEVLEVDGLLAGQAIVVDLAAAKVVGAAGGPVDYSETLYLLFTYIDVNGKIATAPVWTMCPPDGSTCKPVLI